MAAMSVVVLYLASVLPTLKLTACVIASAIVCVVMIKMGIKGAFAVYIASAVLAVFVSPEKLIPIAYLAFFGNYPVLKALIERKNNLKIEWIFKVLVFVVYGAVAVVVVHFFASVLLPVDFIIVYPWTYVGAFAVFVVGAIIFDIALSFLITELVRRFSKIL